MASLTRKKINGRDYYYLRECRRVDGKPKVVKTVYLGSADDIAEALGKQPCGLQVLPRAPVYEFGAVAALLDMAKRVDLVETIDRHVPKQGGRGPSVGTYLMLAAINRAVAPGSKAQLGDWFAGTSLARLVDAKPNQLTSQRFWDNMDRVSEEAIRNIERDISKKVVSDFSLDVGCLFYDATNFFTFIDTFNERPELAQRGKSKEGRSNLRILGLALMVTGDSQVPLFHHLYAGNQADAPTFRSLVDDLAARYKLVAASGEKITIVFDKGNNAEDILESLSDGPYQVVGSLVPTQHEDLLATPMRKLRRLDPEVFKSEVLCYRTEKTVYGRKYTVLVTWNENLFDAQTKTIEREVGKRQEKLRDYQRYLERWRRGKGRGKRPTVQQVKKAVKRILSGRHMKDLFSIDLSEDPETDGLPKLRYRFDGRAYQKLQRTLLGKTLLFTDNDDWEDERIVLAYRGQHHVENSFRQMKDPHHLAFRPAFHWTDQKLRVHALYCVLTLLLCTLLRRELQDKRITVSINRMLDTLASIKEVHVLLTKGRGRPRLRRAHSDLDPMAAKTYEALDLQRYLVT